MNAVVESQFVAPKTAIPAIFVSQRRGLRKIKPQQSLLKINNVVSKDQAKNYIGNCVAFYTQKKDGTQRVNYGRIINTHGKSGIVRAKFSRNLPPKAISTLVYVKLYKIGEHEI